MRTFYLNYLKTNNNQKTKQVMKELNIDCLEGLMVNHELNQVLSECVKARRSEMSVTEIASISGKSESTIKRFENGKVDSLFLLQLYIEKFTKFE